MFADEFGLRGSSLAADFNGDGRVDLVDFAIMRGNLGNSVSPPNFPAAAPGAPLSAPAAGGEAGLDVRAPAAAAASVNPPAAGDQSTVISDQLTANDNDAAAVDLLMELPSAGGYISGVPAISGGLSAPALPRAATSAYDLRPLNDDPVTDAPGDDLLADILAESVLAVRL